MYGIALAMIVAASSGQTPLAPETKPVVLVMTNPQASGSGFFDSLRIQLVNSGVVRAGPVLSRGGLADKLKRASNLAAQQQAQLVVWIEPRSGGGGSEYVLFVVNPKKGASNVELFRIRARPGPDLDRTLALKVSDVLDQVIAGKAVPSSVWVMEPPPLYEAPPRHRWTVVATGHATLGTGEPSAQGALAVGAGRQIDWQRYALNYGGVIAGDFGVSRVAVEGEVSTRELVPGAFASLMRRLGDTSVGLSVGARLRLVQAKGRTMNNNTGDRVVAVPTFAAGMEVRVGLSNHLQLRFVVGGDLATRRRKFAVNDEELVDLGLFRGEVQIGLSMFLP